MLRALLGELAPARGRLVLQRLAGRSRRRRVRAAALRAESDPADDGARVRPGGAGGGPRQRDGTTGAPPVGARPRRAGRARAPQPRYGTHVALFHGGRVESGPAAELLRPERLAHAYGVAPPAAGVPA